MGLKSSVSKQGAPFRDLDEKKILMNRLDFCLAGVAGRSIPLLCHDKQNLVQILFRVTLVAPLSTLSLQFLGGMVTLIHSLVATR